MEFTGNLYFKGEPVKRTETFVVRDFVLEVVDLKNPKFNNYVQFQLKNDRCGLIDSYNIGDALHVTFDIRGRRWQSPEGRVAYFTSLDAWRVEPQSALTVTNQPASATPTAPASVGSTGEQSTDDLPF